MTQVHFGGYTDAVDRTKPVGAVGWHGEAYSYLNSYYVPELGQTGILINNGGGYSANHTGAMTVDGISIPTGTTGFETSIVNAGIVNNETALFKSDGTFIGVVTAQSATTITEAQVLQYWLTTQIILRSLSSRSWFGILS